jgi:hypothetical protein
MRDGAISYEIADFFEAALLKKPNLILDMLEENLPQFEAWLDQIGTQIFWDQSGDDLGQKMKLKDQILASLSDYKKKRETRGKRSEMVSRLIQVTQNVQPYSVG